MGLQWVKTSLQWAEKAQLNSPGENAALLPAASANTREKEKPMELATLDLR